MMQSTSSFTLVMNVSTVTMSNFVSNDCCVMTDNIGCVVNIFVLIMTVLGHNVFTLLNDGRGNNHFMFFMTNLLMVTFFFKQDVIVKSAIGMTTIEMSCLSKCRK